MVALPFTNLRDSIPRLRPGMSKGCLGANREVDQLKKGDKSYGDHDHRGGKDISTVSLRWKYGR